MPNPPESEKNLYIYEEDHIVRTGLLGYYDPLLYSDIYSTSLSALNVRYDTLPSSNVTETLPSGINAAVFDLTITTGSYSYYRYILNTFSDSLIGYWPLWEPSGIVANDIHDGFNGQYVSVGLGQSGIGDGNNSGSFNGTSSLVALYGDLLSSSFSGSEGSLMVWHKISGSPQWFDGLQHTVLSIQTDANNIISFYKHPTDYVLFYRYKAGGTDKTKSTSSYSQLGWQCSVLTWSRSLFRVNFYINATNIYSSTSGSWAGNPLTIAIGSAANTALSTWQGKIAHVALWDRELSASEIVNLYPSFLTSGATRITVLGDSISTNYTNGWQELVIQSYNDGNGSVINHAGAGETIMGYMDIQTSEAASDNANIIIIELGSNDADDSGITAEYEENLLRLKTSNPNAVIYGMGILPATVSSSAVNNPRIETACNNAGVTYWDTTGWIVPATDTSDGTHPNAGGHMKIASEVLARL